MFFKRELTMTQGRHKNWSFWRSHIFRHGENLAKQHGSNSLPIPLKRIAEKRKVRNVIFRPLLVDGCLTITDEGFNIYVCCKKGESQAVKTKYETENLADVLPARMRFTIAHEIAHTFFFDLTGGRPRNRLVGDHQNTVRTLETVCNQTAARMLLPTDLVREEIKNLNIYDPTTLRKLAQKAVVSPHMLVNRMGELYYYLPGVGGFGYAEHDGYAYRLKAIRMHSLLQGVFPTVKAGCVITDLISDPNFVLNGGTQYEDAVTLKCRTEYSTFTQKFRFICEPQSNEKKPKGVFLTFQRLD
jgi:hypothetical protein